MWLCGPWVEVEVRRQRGSEAAAAPGWCPMRICNLCTFLHCKQSIAMVSGMTASKSRALHMSCVGPLTSRHAAAPPGLLARLLPPGRHSGPVRAPKVGLITEIHCKPKGARKKPSIRGGVQWDAWVSRKYRRGDLVARQSIVQVLKRRASLK